MAMCSVYQAQTYTSSVPTPVINTVPIPPKPLPPIAPPPAVKLGQEGFKKVCRSEEDSPSPFPGLPSGVLEMRVKEGSKIRNLMGFAMARMQGEKGTSGTEGSARGLRQVVFSGSGRAVTKTITCAEIMKRKVGSLHQLTKLRYKTVKEVWENNPLDPTEPGYQPPEALSALWEEKEGFDSSQSAACKRPPPLPYSPAFPLAKECVWGKGLELHSLLCDCRLNLCQTVERIESEGVHLELPSTQAQC
ncbi:hypothetical protein WMY93_013687 [Mugilogobius chulae]|uniref:DNA/RNA-binding protein Alba-like domain-containing protein n=1 Tax=Mugilogobius chulae TaxID=88201 RepID=A0AAW0P0Q3_9GOBI